MAMGQQFKHMHSLGPVARSIQSGYQDQNASLGAAPHLRCNVDIVVNVGTPSVWTLLSPPT